MALSGSFTGTTSNNSIVPKIVWSGVQSHSGKYTDVTATLYYSRTDSYRTEGSWTGSISIGGTSTSGSDYISITYNSNTKAMSATVRVYHDVDGSKTINISASGGAPATTLKTTTISQNVTLDQIPVPSAVSATDTNIGSQTTISIVPASSKFTHTLTYKFGTLTGTIATKTASTKVYWTVPTTFYAKIPNSPSGECVITCTTYNGSNQIGTSTAVFVAHADKSICSPSVSVISVVADRESIELTGSNKKIVGGISTLNVATTATAKNSASIKTISVYCGGVKQSGADVMYSGANSAEVYVIVTDSRGYTTRVDDDSLTLINYITPTVIQEIIRDEPTGDTVTVSVRGKWFNGSFGEVTNTLRIRVKYKVDGAADYGVYSDATVTKSGNSYNATLKLSGLAYTNAYRFQIRLDDEVYTDTKGYRDAKYVANILLSKGIPVFDWGENDFNFNVPVYFNGKSLTDIIYPVGSVYIAYDHISPATRFGGTWTRIQNAFLWGIDSAGTVGKTGGEQTHTLSVDEIPEHRHVLSVYTGSSVSEAGLRAAATRSYYSSVVDSSADNISKVGGGKAHNNMPPYVQVSIWRRTA